MMWLRIFIKTPFMYLRVPMSLFSYSKNQSIFSTWRHHQSTKMLSIKELSHSLSFEIINPFDHNYWYLPSTQLQNTLNHIIRITSIAPLTFPFPTTMHSMTRSGGNSQPSHKMAPPRVRHVTCACDAPRTLALFLLETIKNNRNNTVLVRSRIN